MESQIIDLNKENEEKYNALTASSQEEISKYENQIKMFKEQYSDLQTKNTDLSSLNTTLTQKIKELEN